MNKNIKPLKPLQKEYEKYMQTVTDNFIYSKPDSDFFNYNQFDEKWFEINKMTYEEFVNKTINGIIPERQIKKTLSKEQQKSINFYTWDIIIK